MEILKVYPSAEELSIINTKVHCTEQSCSQVFKSESNLQLHLAKTHRLVAKVTNANESKQYHCPITDCIYNEKKFFQTRKQIKQHYLKVHGSKTFVCELCSKGFPSESARKSHVEYCGVSFKCCDCDISYPCYESLKTHGRRKKHKVFEKACYKKGEVILTRPLQGNEKVTSVTCTGQRLILPRPIQTQPINVQVIFVPLQQKESQFVDKGCQTEIACKPKAKKIVNLKATKRSSQETQTAVSKKRKLSAQIQITDNTETTKSADFGSASMTHSSVQKDQNTQTASVISKNVSCNTSFVFNDADFVLTNPTKTSSSSTQTKLNSDVYSLNGVTYNSTHTDTSDLNIDGFFNNLDFLCNVETQTELLSDDLLNGDYYSDMHTQTCQNMLLPDIGGLNDIGTQTIVDEMLQSAESRMLTHSSVKKNQDTQTASVIFKNVSCNTSFVFKDADFVLTDLTKTSSSSTQTKLDSDIYSLNGVTYNSTHTDTSDLNIDGFFNNLDFPCNMETQTELLSDDLLNCDYYSDMHTQTCQNMLLPDIGGFNDIETQTVVDEILRSVESQTLMSHLRKNYFNGRDISHIETQTDIQFKKILEEINA